MVALRLGYGLGAVALATALVACGVEVDGTEDAGALSARLDGPGLGGSGATSERGSEVMVVTTDGRLFGGNDWRDFVPVPLPAGTKVRAAHGFGTSGYPGSKSERYIDGDGRVFERWADFYSLGTWHAVPANGGSAKFVDITAINDEVLAVTEAGNIMVRFVSPMGPIFVDDPLFKVKIGSVEEKVSRIDQCMSWRDVLAVSKDQRRLFKMTRSTGKWEALSLADFPGNKAKPVHILDVGCAASYHEPTEVVVGYREGEGAGVYRRRVFENGGGFYWQTVVEGVPWRTITRVDADEGGDVWFVAFDYGNGTKLWRKPAVDYGSMTRVDIDGTPADVGM